MESNEVRQIGSSLASAAVTTAAKRVQKTSGRLKLQRHIANMRERRRMMLINKGFELLRNKLPIDEYISTESRQGEQDSVKPRKRYRLTKVDILKLTVEYIKQLKGLLNGTQEKLELNIGISFQPNRIRAHNREFRRRYRKQPFLRSKIHPKLEGKNGFVVFWKPKSSQASNLSGFFLSWSRKDDSYFYAGNSTTGIRGTILWMPATE